MTPERESKHAHPTLRTPTATLFPRHRKDEMTSFQHRYETTAADHLAKLERFMGKSVVVRRFVWFEHSFGQSFLGRQLSRRKQLGFEKLGCRLVARGLCSPSLANQ